MATQRAHSHSDTPRIPMRRTSWYMQLLLILTALIAAGVVYGFWQISSAPAPGAVEPEPASSPDREPTY